MDIIGDGFVVLRGRDPVPLLRSAFPDFFAVVDFDIADDEPFLAYGAFADHLLRHRTDTVLWARSIAFFDDVATNDPTLHELLSVGVFEPLCEDAEAAAVLRATCGPAARALVGEL